MGVTLTSEPDLFHWRLTSSGMFSFESMYMDLINFRLVFRSKNIWKTKVPQKTTILCGLCIGVLLLLRTIWQSVGGKVVNNIISLIRRKEYIIYLLTASLLLYFGVDSCGINLPPPTSIVNMFGNSLGGFEPKTKEHICVGVCSSFWVLWNYQNDCICTE